MKVLESARIGFVQGMYKDNHYAVLKYVRENSEGVDKIAMVRRRSCIDSEITMYTFWFKGINGKRDVRYTYLSEVV